MTELEWDESVADQYTDNVASITTLHAGDLISALFAEICRAKTILDVGCGSGAFGLAYLKVFPKGIEGQTLILSDISPGMVRKAQSVMEEHLPDDFKTKMEYKVEDGSVLEGVSENSVDVLVSIFGVFLIPDRVKTMSTIRRVLNKETGVFGMTSWSNITDNESLDSEGFGPNLHDIVQATLKILIPGFGDGKSPPWDAWVNPDSVKKIMKEEAGFGTVKLYRSLHTIAWPSAESMWKMLTAVPAPGMSKEPSVVDAAKQNAMKMVHATDSSRPTFVWTVSNIVIARGDPTDTNQ